MQSNLEMPTFSPQHGFENYLCYHYYHYILAAGKLGRIDSNKTELGYFILTSWCEIIWMKSSSISLEGYSSKMQKVSRCRPKVSNKMFLATRQEFITTKVPPVQSITDIVSLLDYYCSPECLFGPILLLIFS